MSVIIHETVTRVIPEETPVNVFFNSPGTNVITTITPVTVKLNNAVLLQSGGDSGNVLEVPFGYGDATPKVVTNTSGLVTRASIIILQPFNGEALLRLGDSDQIDRLIPAHYVDVFGVAEYEITPLVRYASVTEILLSIELIGDVTQGSGLVVLEMS